MSIYELRKAVKARFPHITVKIKTVSFGDLARASKRTIRVCGDRSAIELQAVNELAATAGILPDGNIRFSNH